jgi:hypothetical protein
MNSAGDKSLMPDPFSVLVLYEDRQTRDRVLASSRHLELQLGKEEDVELQFTWWKFSFLREPDLAEQAASSAMLADMLIISARAGRGLPLEFTTWVESWLPRRERRESVLVALIGSDHDSMEAVVAASEYLRGIAARAGMDYLARPLLRPAAAAPAASADSLQDRAETNTPVLEEVFKRVHPPSHWGINE